MYDYIIAGLVLTGRLPIVSHAVYDYIIAGLVLTGRLTVVSHAVYDYITALQMMGFGDPRKVFD